MKAGFYQFNPVFGEKHKNIDKVIRAVQDAEIELLVLPEFFATGYQFVSKEEVAELSEQIPNGYTTEILVELSLPGRYSGTLIRSDRLRRAQERYTGAS